MNHIKECIELAKPISPADAKKAEEELAELRKQLEEANEIISMTAASVSRDEVESVQSLARDYVQRWEVE